MNTTIDVMNWQETLYRKEYKHMKIGIDLGGSHIAVRISR